MLRTCTGQSINYLMSIVITYLIVIQPLNLLIISVIIFSARSGKNLMLMLPLVVTLTRTITILILCVDYVNSNLLLKILCIIMKCPSKSCSLDPMPAWLVKQHLPVLTPILTKIVNSSLSSGSFPSGLRRAIAYSKESFLRQKILWAIIVLWQFTFCWQVD